MTNGNDANGAGGEALGGHRSAPPLDGKVFLFNKPELLNVEDHANLGISRPPRLFSFVEKARGVPLLVTEFFPGHRHYPVVFAQQGEKTTPIAAVGLLEDVNLFVNPDGDWEPFVYVPAYVRRYPFSMARDDNRQQFALVIDRTADMISETPEQPFFQNGQLTDHVTNVIEFCKNYEVDRQRTDAFCEKLKEFDLLRPQEVKHSIDQNSEPQVIASYIAVDENRLKELPDEQFLELRKSGVLPFIYAHLLSLSNWQWLVGRRQKLQTGGAQTPIGLGGFGGSGDGFA